MIRSEIPLEPAFLPFLPAPPPGEREEGTAARVEEEDDLGWEGPAVTTPPSKIRLPTVADTD